MKLDLICFINSASDNVNFLNFEDTIESINRCANCNIKFFIITDCEERKNSFYEIFLKLGLQNTILDIVYDQDSWANCFNRFYEKYNNQTNYILVSHDDVKVRTFNFFNMTIESISNYESDIAWIGFTSDHYYKNEGRLITQSAREIFCKDAENAQRIPMKIFELHNMDNSYDESKLDYPDRVCKVPGIYSHFNMIKSENLNKIGLCENWGDYTLLIDEDWSLSTLVNNMWTVWVPNIFYDHPLRYEQRKRTGIKDEKNVNEMFKIKWGFSYLDGYPSKEKISEICNRFPNTNIDFFNNKNSYEYQYFE